ncbi:MAG: toprim domain-containing protein [gamma proteobacterium endosymbiont of Lamellibrachia anaximandri]|nr:toprim domain-containing protein [gamma proteobacterium endosymbiont of Lamellibrachia anaximandri]MBL3535252.1 toprim domain-containing protein [gamma proteobacterium endosymbiont of Lamellibrachia anaximandri]
MVSVHRTYLTKYGYKAPVESAKKIMGVPYPLTCSGAAIRLYPAGKTLAIAEGIETALALRVSLRMRVWAAISAHGLETIVIPNKVERVLIGADNDKNGRGQLAASRLAKRLRHEGREVRIITPEQVGSDWADVLLEGGLI